MASSTTTIDTFVDKTYQNDFFKRMHNLRLNEDFTDVTLLSGDVKIQCHRNVLAVTSDCFKAMISGDLRESAAETIRLTLKPETMTSIVDYIYTGQIELTISNVKNIVEASDVFKLDTLKASCEQYMLKQVEQESCIGYYRHAAMYRLNSLQQAARHVMLSDFKSVAFTDEFKELSCTELIDYVKDDDISVEYEDIVVEAVLGWVRYDLSNRKSSFETILEHVRLPYCTSTYMRHIRDGVDMLTPKCFEYLHEASSFQADTSHQHEISSCRTAPRTNYRMKSRLLVVGEKHVEGANERKCVYYDDSVNSWKSLMELPYSDCSYYNVCRVDRGLLVTGGLKRSVVDECWLYDLAAKQWDKMPPLITARYLHRSVSFGDCVYVVGGELRGGKVLKCVECFDLNKRRWTSMPDMLIQTTAPMVTTYSNKIFVFGGRDAKNKTLCCSLLFNTRQGRWSTLADTPEVCDLGAAVTLNDCIYLVGGYTRTCLKYDPSLDSWTSLSRPQHEHGMAPAVA